MRLFEAPRATVELRDYQTHTLELIRDAMESGYRRILVCAPPGTGKGTLIAHIVQAAKERGNASLFVVHRRELVRDMSARVSKLGIEHSRVLPGWDVKSYADVYVSTIQSYLSNYRKRWIVRAPVVIIIDEAHRITPGDGMYHELLSTFPNAIVLGFTATRETALQFAAYELESWGLHEDGEPCPICRKFGVEPHDTPMREEKE